MLEYNIQQSSSVNTNRDLPSQLAEQVRPLDCWPGTYINQKAHTCSAEIVQAKICSNFTFLHVSTLYCTSATLCYAHTLAEQGRSHQI